MTRRDVAKYYKKRLILRLGDTTISLRKFKHQRNHDMFYKKTKFQSSKKKFSLFLMLFCWVKKWEIFAFSGYRKKILIFPFWYIAHWFINNFLINYLFPFPNQSEWFCFYLKMFSLGNPFCIYEFNPQLWFHILIFRKLICPLQQS